jgi:Tol biopolymer transport system component
MATMGGCYNSSTDLSEIYRINADGTGLVNLTPQPIEGFIYSLDVSPDGTQIAFLLNPGRNARGVMVYTMNADGTNLQPVLTDSGGVRYTSLLWSPDGTQLLLQDASSTRSRQSLMSATGTEPDVIRAFQRGLKIEVTQWAADGRFFAFDQMGGLLWVNPDGSERTPLDSFEPVAASYLPHAVPSPDLSRLAYFIQLAEPQFGTDALVITDANGVTEHIYTDVVPDESTNLDVDPALRWSPDGAQIAYISSSSIQIIASDGTGRRQVTPDALLVFAFDWLSSP